MTEIEMTFKVRKVDGGEKTYSLRDIYNAAEVSSQLGWAMGEIAVLASRDEVDEVLRGFGLALGRYEGEVIGELSSCLRRAYSDQMDPRKCIEVKWIGQDCNKAEQESQPCR